MTQTTEQPKKQKDKGQTSNGQKINEQKFKKQKDKEQKPKYNMWQNCAFMIALAWREKEKKVLVLSFLTAVLAVATNLTDTYMAPTVLGCLETGAPLGQLLATILLFVGLSALFQIAMTYVRTNNSYGKITVRGALLRMVNHKASVTSYPNLYEDKFEKLNHKARNTLNHNNAPGEAIWNTMTGLFQNLLGFVIYLCLLSAVNPLLFAIITAISILEYLINKPINEYRYRHREEDAEFSRILNCTQRYMEHVKLAKDVRLFGMRPWLEEVFTKALETSAAFNRRVANVQIWSRIVDLVLAFLRNGITYAYLIYLVLAGDLSVSLFLLYFNASGQFTSWVTHIVGSLLSLHSQSLELSSMREFLEYPEPFRFEEGKPLTLPEKHACEIRLEDVTYRYPGAEQDTLSHINLTLHPGEKLAIVGLNGAGKTTLVKLLCGFLDPTQGRVLLDGQDIRQYNRRDYYTLFSAVFQDFAPLAGTVAVNVAQTEENIERDRVRDCIAKAGLQEKIESLPGQYDTRLDREVYEDAVMLSGGETQRLMLARALYKDAPFVVLDEPTAALDPIAEADLYGKYNEMTQGRSSVYISHRLASTRFCDRIIFIKDGRIAEEGTHDTLLALGGSYTELFQVQSKYYQEGDIDNGQ